MLRNFSYLDAEALDQYLAQLQGSVGDNYAERATGKRGGKVGMEYRGTGVEYSGSKEVEISQTRKIPAAARFKRLHDLLTESEDIQYLDGFDDEIWQQLKRGELLEIQASIRLPESVSLMQTLPALGQVFGAMERLTETPLNDPEEAEKYKAFMELMSGKEDGQVPIVFEAISTPSYTFAGKLKKDHLLVDVSELEGEAVVVGKIIRLLFPGKEEEFASITPEIGKLFQFMNRQQRRATKGAAPPAMLVEKITGPAAILAILAVFT